MPGKTLSSAAMTKSKHSSPSSYLFLLLLFVSSSSSLRLPLHHVTELLDQGSSSYSSLLDRGRRQIDDTFNVLDVEDSSASSGIFSLRGKPGLGYYVTMSFGTPPQLLNVLVDSGSSNLALACAPDPFVERFFTSNTSSSWEPTGVRVMVPYTQGKWEGNLGTELVSMGEEEVVEVEMDAKGRPL